MGAERAIAKANPPKQRGPRPDNFVSPEHEIEPSVVRHMRAVHSKLSDTQFEARTVQAIESETPLTRQSLKAPCHPTAGRCA